MGESYGYSFLDILDLVVLVLVFTRGLLYTHIDIVDRYR